MKTVNPKDKFAIVTGASCGIGAVFAREFASQGYHLLITGRRKTLLFKFAKELRQRFHIRVIPLVLEFSVKRDLDKLMREISKLRNIEVLVNNAGFGLEKKFSSDSFRNQEKMLKVHINATCLITHGTIPMMMANKKGKIINVSSLAAFTPMAGNHLYSSSKAFIITFSECLHLALRDHNIRVQALCPGFTSTEFHKKLTVSDDQLKARKPIAWMSAERVVKQSLTALQKRRKVIFVPGILNKCIFNVVRFIPKNLYYVLAQRLMAA